MQNEMVSEKITNKQKGGKIKEHRGRGGKKGVQARREGG